MDAWIAGKASFGQAIELGVAFVTNSKRATAKPYPGTSDLQPTNPSKTTKFSNIRQALT